MDRLILIFALAAFISTLVGGAIIVKFRKYLPFFFAFAAGSLIAVSFLDLLPESLELAGSVNIPVRYVMITVVLSFFLYSLIERFLLTHHIGDHDDHNHIMGPIGAGSLILHSFLDGAAIGAAFRINASVGLIVALAVIFHDFTDGINTVTLMLKNKQHIKRTITFLVFDALAPFVGILATTTINISESVLAIMLAAFVGEFLYIGASTLLPETRNNLSKGVVIAMATGIFLIMLLTSFI